jgi:hypothetical protein
MPFNGMAAAPTAWWAPVSTAPASTLAPVSTVSNFHESFDQVAPASHTMDPVTPFALSDQIVNERAPVSTPPLSDDGQSFNQFAPALNTMDTFSNPPPSYYEQMAYGGHTFNPEPSVLAENAQHGSAYESDRKTSLE